MIIELSEIEFVNDFYYVNLPDDRVLILNKIDENFSIDGIESELKRINVLIQDTDESVIDCSYVIGLNGDLLKISTKYTEYEGAVLTSDNMKYCTIEVYE